MRLLKTPYSKFPALFLLLALVCSSCEKNPIIQQEMKFTSLGFNESSKIISQNGNAFTVTYTKLIEDSRCPDGSACPWEGRALIEALINDEKYILGIGDLSNTVPTGIQNSVLIGSTTFLLLDIKYPSENDRGNASKSTVFYTVK